MKSILSHIRIFLSSAFAGRLLQLISLLLICLWVYTAMMKFGNMASNIDSMHKQFFPASVGTALAYLVPALAALAAILLYYRPKAGLLLSIGLLTAFSLFIAAAYSNIFSGQTCACAGIFPKKGYLFHLAFNIPLLALAGLGLAIHKQQKCGDAENRQQSRQKKNFIIKMIKL